MDWSQIIGEIKQYLNINTSELARRLDVTSHYLADIERGKSKKPSAILAGSLISKLGVNPYWLFGNEKEILTNENHLKLRITSLEKENLDLKNKLKKENISLDEALKLLSMISKLKNEDLEKVMAFIEKMGDR